VALLWAIERAFAVECQNAEGAPDQARRLTLQTLDENVSHAHPRPGETGNGVAGWVVQHLLECRGSQAMQNVRLIEQE
jgi:hypothetical protein